MAKKAKSKTEPEAKHVEAVSEAKPVRGAKTKAIKAALKAHKDKSPKEIAEIVTATGITTTAGQVSNVKSILAAKKKAKAAPAPEVAAAPAVAKDAVSVGLLQKAKKLAAQLGGIKAAKQAIDALAQIMD
jgi:chemotaxis protein CheY-P-specific phosphatase CheC